MPWHQLGRVYHRVLGDSEFALFAPSQTGVGDMFLHLSLRAPAHYFAPERVTLAWALIRKRNPLLMSRVVLVEGETRFAFTPPTHLTQDAASSLEFTRQPKHTLISSYMDGEYQVFMCSPHFCGDGTTLHVCTHELLRLVSSTKTNDELRFDLQSTVNWIDILPTSLEERLLVPRSRLSRAAFQVNYLQALSKELGGHTLPRIQRAEMQTAFEEVEFSQETTANILAKCKANGVTINHALVALSTIAWARCTDQSLELPIMLYTAANLRANLVPSHPDCSDTFLALAYFTISLPAFPPPGTGGVWHRARLAKTQMQNAVRSPLLPARALLSAASRARRPAPTSSHSLKFTPAPPSSELALRGRPEHSAALMGISLIGNLDRTYLRHEYGRDVELLSVGTASRLKPGGLLLLGHTFGKKLVLQLCWDTMGFAEGAIERFWAGLESAVDEFLVQA
ncbi:hypothetical protein HMN09_00589600 [Mycena chlorophos]|uniref:Phthiocerol/phthiodiolone dimycocerosyl transferase C-terminal domain-containing protein n=1 Tax=Mycena chlorophos TaxID=658473 RepID=A0A8H6WA53_MYCCL|nr:hypothetical protein HMN09_00589600 [Mycena chlorophos]